MPFLAGVAVVFVGVAGGDHRVEHQVKTLLEHQHVKAEAIDQTLVHTLAHHGEGSREIVQKLHTGGVVSGEIVESHGQFTLRIAIYNGDGGMRSYSETPVAGRTLNKTELEALGSNLEDDVTAMVAKAAQSAPQTAAAAPDEIDMDDAPPAAAPVAPPRVIAKAAPVVAPPRPAPAVVAQARPAPSGELGMAPVATPPVESHTAAPVEVADANADATDSVSADEIESLTGGGGGGVTASAPEQALHLHGAVGLGFAARSFSGPSTIPGYASSAVGAIHFEGAISPIAHTTLSAQAETTLDMTTPVANGIASTSMTRWEVAASYAVLHGAIEVSPEIGIGHRAFSIESTDPMRSPDNSYDYAIIGVTGGASLGHHLALRGIVAFEPVMSGTEPTEMAFGDASRWAVDVGGAVEFRPYAHLFARAALDYQRFSWSWNAAGARGAAGAVDEYPSGTLALGAEY